MSRDWLGDSGFATVASRKVQPTVDPRYQQYGNAFNPAAQSLDEDESPAVGPGVAAWNDFSPLADAARDSLREAAGIEIPKARFVVWVLILYLIVLVPVNWGVFAAIGRVEWAWIAAPIIAVGGMAAVVKLAQLDIGFARSQSEIAILELHNGYPRGHLTRFTALYTSLSTTYDVNPDERTTLILPFCADPNFTPRLGQSIDTVTYHCEPTVQLTDFGVSSNSTSFLHSEEMFDLGRFNRLRGQGRQRGSFEPLETTFAARRGAAAKRSRPARNCGGGRLALRPSAPRSTLCPSTENRPTMPRCCRRSI